MPQHIEHIDAIARKKGRAVLYLEFHPRPFKEWRNYDYQDDATRAAVLAWFDTHAVPWTACGPFANPNVMAPYLGQVYIDVPYDDSLPTYCALRDYLEYPDGSIRHEGVRFYAMPLELAMENAAHDEPGVLGTLGRELLIATNPQSLLRPRRMRRMVPRARAKSRPKKYVSADDGQPLPGLPCRCQRQGRLPGHGTTCTRIDAVFGGTLGRRMRVEEDGDDRDDASEVPGSIVSTVPHSSQLT